MIDTLRSDYHQLFNSIVCIQTRHPKSSQNKQTVLVNCVYDYSIKSPFYGNKSGLFSCVAKTRANPCTGVCDLMDFGYATDKCKQYIKTVPYVIAPVALGFYAVFWVICY